MSSSDIVKLRQGTYQAGGRKPPIVEAQAPNSGVEMRPAPATLGQRGADLWDELGPQLIAHGWLTDMDWQSFELACIAYEQATAPSAASVTLGRWRQFAEMFGLSPMHRGKSDLRILPKRLTGARERVPQSNTG